MYYTKQLQQLLSIGGFYQGRIDGLVGPKTIAAIRAFQTLHGLNPDGIVGPKTLTALQGVYSRYSFVRRRCGPRGLEIIRVFEGKGDGDKSTPELEPYICPANIVTVGYGHVLYDEHGLPISANIGVDAALKKGREAMMRLFGREAISDEEAEQLLAIDVNAFSGDVSVQIDMHGNATDAQFDAFVSCAFNIGTATLAASTLVKLWRGRWSAQPKNAPTWQDLVKYSSTKPPSAPANFWEAFTAYSYSNHVWLLGLFRRRYVEASLFVGNPTMDELKTTIAFAQAHR